MRLAGIVVLCLVPFCRADVDMVMGDEPSNELFISWSDGSSVFLGRYTGGTYTHTVEHQDLNAAAVSRADRPNMPNGARRESPFILMSIGDGGRASPP